MTKKNSLAKNTFLLMVATIMNKGIMVIAIPLFSRWLTTEEYGLFDVYTTYITLLVPLLTLAIGEAVFRYGIEKEGTEHQIAYISSGLFVTVVGVFFLIIVSFLFFENNYQIMIPFMLYAIMDILGEYLLGFMRTIRKISYYAICSIASTLLVFLLTFLFVKILGFGVSGIMFAYAVSSGAKNLIIIIITKFYKYINFNSINKAMIFEMLKYSVMLVLSNISWWIVNVSDRWLIKCFLGVSSNGIYAAACKIPNLVASLTAMFSISWQEAAIDELNSENRSKYFDSIYNKMLVLILSISTCLTASNFLIFGLFFDSRYEEGRVYLPILAASSVFHAMIFFFNGINISLKKPKANSVSVFVGAVTNFIINISLINHVQLYAAAISTLVSNAIIFLVMMISVRKVYIPNHKPQTIICILIFLYFSIIQYCPISNELVLILLISASLVFSHLFLIKISSYLKSILYIDGSKNN